MEDYFFLADEEYPCINFDKCVSALHCQLVAMASTVRERRGGLEYVCHCFILASLNRHISCTWTLLSIFPGTIALLTNWRLCRVLQKRTKRDQEHKPRGRRMVHGPCRMFAEKGSLVLSFVLSSNAPLEFHSSSRPRSRPTSGAWHLVTIAYTQRLAFPSAFTQKGTRDKASTMFSVYVCVRPMVATSFFGWGLGPPLVVYRRRHLSHRHHAIAV